METEPAFKTMCFKKLDDKGGWGWGAGLRQLTSITLCSLFWICLGPTGCPKTSASQKSADLKWRFGDADLGLARHGPVQNDLVWCGSVQRFMQEYKMISHTYAPNLGEKTWSCIQVNTVYVDHAADCLLQESSSIYTDRGYQQLKNSKSINRNKNI